MSSRARAHAAGMARRAALGLAALAAACLARPVLADAGLPACAPDQVHLAAGAGAITYQVEIADEPAERARGLMFRQSMDLDAGMLFLFDRPAPQSFWMRNTFIPLDIIFVDASGTVLNVAENTVPFSETRIPSDGDAAAVLEVNAGQAAARGIGPGTQLLHPAFDGKPGALGCE